ncbi:ATP-sensitive inward rectifier potassium channel 12-like isoform X2 [Paramacrobiotus metropolitanus]|uniref:ATP-sensitive inward rectifier potassium channel 12-like isoform X2 n=1 Tax=Paramacrobiotus metropolitanus TaxID=2943436 RepID=UPI002445AF08|nr:ATP-sensitive inward rectifier potassium channel 12-like isoform X2 [Paramacrobiotus metropolitanus]
MAIHLENNAESEYTNQLSLHCSRACVFVERWETDINPQRRRTTDDQDGFIKRKIHNVRAKSFGDSPIVRQKATNRSRLLLKSGMYNIVGKNIPRLRERYFSDFWNTMIDLKWKYVLLFFLISLVSSWLLFGLIFYLIALVHGDMEEIHEDSKFVPCLVNIHNFASAFLYSIETMHTIGYGARYPTDSCTVSIIAMCVSALIGCALEAFIVGVVFAKFQMPAQRAQTLLFSKNAVICTRDGQLCLLFRIGNMRRSLIIQLVVKAHLVHHRMTQESELMPFHQHELKIQLDSMSGNAFSSWPVTACHLIDAESPIYELSRTSLERAKFEIIVALEGIVENTGAVVQARTSYTPEEIVWGHGFTRLLTFRKEQGEYVVDFNHFQTLEPVRGMTGRSARELDEQKYFSAPESPAFDHKNGPFEPASPTLLRVLTAAAGLEKMDFHCGYDGSPIRQHQSVRRGSRSVLGRDAPHPKEVIRPPSPSLAAAISTHVLPSLIQRTRDQCESDARHFPHVSPENHPHLTPVSQHSMEPMSRTSSMSSLKRHPVVNFFVDAIEEDEKEITKF